MNTRRTEIIAAVNNVEWDLLQTSNGVTGLGEALARMLSPDVSEWVPALQDVYDGTDQGTISEATVHALPILTTIAITPEVKVGEHVLELIGDIAEGVPALSPELESALPQMFFDSFRRMQTLFYSTSESVRTRVGYAAARLVGRHDLPGAYAEARDALFDIIAANLETEPSVSVITSWLLALHKADCPLKRVPRIQEFYGGSFGRIVQIAAAMLLIARRTEAADDANRILADSLNARNEWQDEFAISPELEWGWKLDEGDNERVARAHKVLNPWRLNPARVIESICRFAPLAGRSVYAAEPLIQFVNTETRRGDYMSSSLPLIFDFLIDRSRDIGSQPVAIELLSAFAENGTWWTGGSSEARALLRQFGVPETREELRRYLLSF